MRNGFCDHDVRTFSERDADLRYTLPDSTFHDVLAQLPAGWEPDLVFFFYPEVQCLVPGIAECPYPTVLAVSDWHCSFESVRDVCSMFDAVVTDRCGVDLLRGTTDVPVLYHPLYGFDPSLHRRLPDVAHACDVGVAADLSSELNRDRARILVRGASLVGRYRVRYFTNVLGEDYTRCVNESRITLNHSVRGEMSMRCYEAAACGSLLFCERSNREVRDFFEDRVHCVLYGDDDLESLLEHYLEHEDEWRRITDAAHAKVQEHSYRHHMNALVEHLKGLRVGPLRQGRRLEREQTLAVAGQAYASGDPQASALAVVDAERGLRLAPLDSELLNVLACAAAAAAADPDADAELRRSLLDRAEEAFGQALPTRMTLLSFARFLVASDRPVEARAQLRLALQASFAPAPYYPRRHDRFFFEWERNRDDRERLTRWKIHELLADLEPEVAEAHLRDAVAVRPDIGSTWHRLASALPAAATEERIQALRHAVGSDPLAMAARHDLIRALWSRHRVEAIGLASQTMQILTAFPYSDQQTTALVELLEELR